MRSFQTAFINYFAANRLNLLTAGLTASQININRKINSVASKIFKSKINFIEPVKDIYLYSKTDASQRITWFMSWLEDRLLSWK